ncbi:MAG: methyltransferase domain-containing protein [Ardenticatenaceae bacterium]|nr:methyltransferase domain-containing protein [Ardenticatenaceae bacterium]
MNLTRRIDIIKRFFGRGVCPYQVAFTLSNPLRRLILSPEELVARLELSEGARVLELGPGPGYFSVEVARSIPRGYLLLLDIQLEMLEMARQRLHKAGMRHAGYAQGDASALPVDDGALDAVFLVAVLGEAPDPRACVQEVYRVLRPNGLLSNTEQPGDPDFMSPAEVRALAQGAGFRVEQVYGSVKNYTINFRKSV